ncbi:MAG: hypothetical protein E7465_10440 [Ruminococcaceae bacterium]|nr:hypothetical protein [Oscillospiraceae bacterium]
MNNSLRRRFERFCFQNRNKGIPDLMLYICLGSAIVSFASMMNGGTVLYNLLCFDKAAILRGQVWRLVSWLLTEQLGGNPVLSVLFLYFFYRLGKAVEMSIGTFKFNLFYLGGVILMDLFALIFCPTESVVISNMIFPPEVFTAFYSNMAYYLHLSMVLAFSTMYPDSQFMIFFVIPVKAWVLALIDLILIGISVFNLCYPIMLFPHCLFPLIGLLNYFIFFGGDMHNLLPLSWRVKLRRKTGKASHQSSRPKVVPFNAPGKQEAEKASAPYTHRCTVCGRTDAEYPNLEFRYCSRCKGYHCYCEDHISNHAHIE